MTGGWYARLGLLLGLCAASAYLLYPSYYYYAKATPQQRDDNAAFCRALPTWSHCAKLNLGLDLQGGVHLVLGVRVDKAIEHRLDRLADSLRKTLDEQSLPTVGVERQAAAEVAEHAEPALSLQADDAAARDLAMALVRREYPLFDLEKQGERGALLRLSGDEAANIRDGAVEQTIKGIRNRADRLGVTEPTIARRGADSVLIQLPGVKDPEHAIDVIGKTAQLEFKLLDRRSAALLRLPKPWPAGVRQERDQSGRPSYFLLPEAAQAELAAALEAYVPRNAVLAFGPAHGPNVDEKSGTLRTYLLEARSPLTGDYLNHAQVAQDPRNGSYAVSMGLDHEGTRIFETLTANNVGKPMAIVLDGKVASAPVITEKISGGSAQITMGGRGSAEQRFSEAKDLVLVLKAGALPAPVEVREKRQVGKTLGQDTVAKGTTAMALGTALVVLFMALYYRLSGMLANLALALNVLFMMAVLALLEATLTLPGMAGIVLTIGMAVDANVLIFERIREELRLERSPKAAIEAGYQKAFGTIFDSNVTTLIAGVVLMQYGSGPVRGFAVTLIIGLTCSLYTSIVVTRLAYDAWSHGRKRLSLSI
jgi:preprotein translocase subunit SecD